MHTPSTKPAPSDKPTPFIHAINVFLNEQNKQIIKKTPVDSAGFPMMVPPIYEGQGAAMLRVRTDHGEQIQPHAFVFLIPDCISLADAFARFDAAQEKGMQAEFQRLKIEALRQGGSLGQGPQLSPDGR